MEADYVPIFKDKAQYKSLDPNNKFWAEDKSRFGYRMLQNMGWEDGKGLGSNGDGMTQHVKINKKLSNSGIGEAANSSDNWLKGAFEYGNLLKKLNQTVTTTTTISETTTKIESSSKQRHLYQKRLASRDASGYSKEDMDLILGSQKVKQLAEESSDSEVENESESDDGLVLKTSTVSVYDYFQKKGQLADETKTLEPSAALLSKRSSPDDSDDGPIEPPTKKQKTEKEEEKIVGEETVKKEKKKSKKNKKEKSEKVEKKSEKKKDSKKTKKSKKAFLDKQNKKEKKEKEKSKKTRKEKGDKKKRSSKSSKPSER